VAVAPSPRGALLTLAGSPFDWVEIDTTGKAVLLSGPFDRASRSPSFVNGEEVAGWRSFAVLPIDRGYLQTLEKPDHFEANHAALRCPGTAEQQTAARRHPSLRCKLHRTPQAVLHPVSQPVGYPFACQRVCLLTPGVWQFTRTAVSHSLGAGFHAPAVGLTRHYRHRSVAP
jgi:hypothetical protein